jgi:DNA-3-methyladenine glycosylase
LHSGKILSSIHIVFGQVAPTAATPPALPQSFFARPAEVVAPELIGCLLVKRQAGGELLWGVIVETEAYCQSEPACHGHRRRTPSNETLFGEPGRFYVYVSYGIHHCVNVVTHRAEWASGVLLRAAALPAGPEGQAAGPGLLARCFGFDRGDDGRPVSGEAGLWLAPRPPAVAQLLAEEAGRGQEPLRQAVRIGVSQGQDLPWRWYLAASRCVSRRAPGDRRPRSDHLAPLLAQLPGALPAGAGPGGAYGWKVS